MCLFIYTICYISGSSIIAGTEPGLYICEPAWYEAEGGKIALCKGLAALPQLLWSPGDEYIILFNFTQYLYLPGTEPTYLAQR